MLKSGNTGCLHSIHSNFHHQIESNFDLKVCLAILVIQATLDVYTVYIVIYQSNFDLKVCLAILVIQATLDIYTVYIVIFTINQILI